MDVVVSSNGLWNLWERSIEHTFEREVLTHIESCLPSSALLNMSTSVRTSHGHHMDTTEAEELWYINRDPHKFLQLRR